MSKGSKQRPIKDKNQYDKNYDRIFKKKENKSTEPRYNYTTKEIIEAMDRINERR